MDSSEPEKREQKLIDAARRQARGPATEPTQPAGAQQAETQAFRARSVLGADSFPGYEILREIHRGGQGVVYQAFQESTKRKVAIKVMKEGPFAGPADKSRFEREVQILGQLKHPHIVTIHDSGEAAGHFYFVMDYISGQPLDAYMANDEYSIDDTLKLFAEICEAVNAAHLRGVIHRDLKPGNIRIDPDGKPHVLDFGLAKVATGEATRAATPQLMTMTGQFVGSLPWASPEQAEAAPGRIDIRTDVYSLGVILYQMLTGRFPYDVIGNMRDVLDRIMTAAPARPSTIRRQVNNEVETIVLKCLAKARERRYQTAGELARDVQHYLAGEPIEAKRDSTLYVIRKQLRRYRGLVAGAAALFLLLLGFGLVMSVQAKRNQRMAEGERAAEEAAEQVTQVLTRIFVDENDERQAWLAELSSEELLARGERIARADLGSKPRQLAAVLEAIGIAYAGITDYSTAERLLQEALATRKALLGDDDAETLRSATSLARLRLSQSRFDEAEALLLDTLPRQRRELGDTHPLTLLSMATLGTVYESTWRYDEAEAVMLETLKLTRGELGEEHHQTAMAMHHLGWLYWCQERYDEAGPLMIESLERARRILGEDHPDTLSAMNNVGVFYVSRGRFDEAEALHRSQLETSRRVLGAEHPDTLMASVNLAGVYENDGRWEKAVPIHAEVLEVRRRVLSERHTDTVFSMRLLAWAYYHLGRYAEAEPLLVRAAQLRREEFGEEHILTQDMMFRLAFVYMRQHRHDLAEPLLVKILEIRRRVLGEDNPYTLATMARLAELYRLEQRYDEAEPLYTVCLERGPQVPGVDGGVLAVGMNGLGLLYTESQRYDEAEPLLKEAVARARQSAGDSDESTGTYWADLGHLLTLRERYGEAESALLEAHEILNTKLGADDERTREVVDALAELYDAWGQPEKAAQWRAKRVTTTAPPGDPRAER